MDLSAEEGAARTFAIERHGAQRYGDNPYVHHLSQVRSVLERFGHQGALCIAAWLHDVLEDTPTSREEIVERFGTEVEQLVWAVTGIGPDRKARNASMYEKVRALPLAATLKLADRIANVEASLAAPAKLEMYRAELPTFREKLSGLGDARMWNHLEKLFGNAK